VTIRKALDRDRPLRDERGRMQGVIDDAEFLELRYMAARLVWSPGQVENLVEAWL
jgi:hypothetical protein